MEPDTPEADVEKRTWLAERAEEVARPDQPIVAAVPPTKYPAPAVMLRGPPTETVVVATLWTPVVPAP